MSDSDEFLILIERWQKTDDPEVVVTAVQAALHLEPKLRQWPLRASREQVKGQLLHALGEGYQERLQGSRADNLEAAIQAYAGALNVATRQAFPQDWAETQNALGKAYRNRIKGLKADNLEAAIRAHEAALTVFTRQASQSSGPWRRTILAAPTASASKAPRPTIWWRRSRPTRRP